ncbi:hypothetical protein FKM82_000128, partial [Ascaphus truei]
MVGRADQSRAVNMDPEVTYEMGACHSHTSMALEEEMITVHSLSPNRLPATAVSEENACSNASKQQNHVADVGLQEHLLAFQHSEEKLMLMHGERHDELMGVQGAMLTEMREIKQIIIHINELFTKHNAFMEQMSHTLMKLVHQSSASVPASTSRPPFLATQQVTLSSPSAVVGQLQQSLDIVAPTPPQNKDVPFDPKTCAALQIGACESEDGTNIHSNHAGCTALDAMVSCHQEGVDDVIPQVDVDSSVAVPNFVTVEQEGCLNVLGASALKKRRRKSNYWKGRSATIKKKQMMTGAVTPTLVLPSQVQIHLPCTSSTTEHRKVQRYNAG